MKKIAIFASGSGTNAEAIMEHFTHNDLIQVALVLSNRSDAYVLRRAEDHSVPSVTFTRDTLYNDTQYILDTLRSYEIDFVVLAGFMLLMPEPIVRAYSGRIINIHPALLPKFGGKGMYGDNVHRAVIEGGESESGITIHYVNERYDSGSIIFQESVNVDPEDTPESLAAKIHKLEHRFFPAVIERTILRDINRKRLLLISNSTNAGEAYLEYPREQIAKFLEGVKNVMFVPYAAVTFSYDEYQAKVQARFEEFGVTVHSVHRYRNPAAVMAEAEAIVVGGGNTFHLVQQMQRNGLMEPIRRKVLDGTPYVGWSAGSNVACPTLCTTNDMPIVEPDSFNCLGLVPFQINPHYLDSHPDGHAGETRQQRIEEYIAANREMYVAGLREGCMLKVEGSQMELIGGRPLRIFRYGQAHSEHQPGEDLSYLLR